MATLGSYMMLSKAFIGEKQPVKVDRHSYASGLGLASEYLI